METIRPNISPAPYHYTEQEEKQLILKHYKQLFKKAELKFKTPEDGKNVKRAFQIAADAHKEMRRKTGEPYILHPIAVARIAVEEIGLGIRSLICALLHDTVEDTSITIDFIKKEFGKEIASIVEGLTKISTIKDVQQSKQAENIKKILVSLVHDPRVILIKLADRLHNMRTLDAMRSEKRIKIAGETMNIYVPIAHRLGLYHIKTELEDLCMKYLDSSLCHEIQNKLKESQEEREDYIKSFIEPVKRLLKKNCDFKFDIQGRTKSVFSIAKKMKTQDIRFEDVYDVFAIRIVVDCEKENEKKFCWEVYSVLSTMFRTLPTRFRDWLSQPKNNGYEALHTTVLGPEARWIEIQIRSKRMNEVAERGVAAHFLYKEKQSKQDVFDVWYMQIRDLIASDNIDSADFVSNFQSQIYDETIYVFTPKGDVKLLPKKGTVLDFAYAIHGNIGDKCIGAKVNHQLQSLSYALTTGDKVEILTSEKQSPKEEWLTFLKTAKAITRIKTHFKGIKKQVQQKGYLLLQTHLEEHNLDISADIWKALLIHFKLGSKEDFYTAIAEQAILLTTITQAFLLKLTETVTEEKTNTTEFQYQRASCCKSIQGDNVLGLLIPNLSANTVHIHLVSCKEAQNLLTKYDCKLMQIKWQEQQMIRFLTTIELSGLDEVGVIFNLTSVMSKQLNINISAFHIEANDGTFAGTIKMYVASKDELESLIKQLLLINGIVKVNRIF